MSKNISDSLKAILADSGGGWLNRTGGGFLRLERPSHILRSAPYKNSSEITLIYPDRSERFIGNPLEALEREIAGGFIAVGYIGYGLARYTDTEFSSEKSSPSSYINNLPELEFLLFKQPSLFETYGAPEINDRSGRTAPKTSRLTLNSNMSKQSYLSMVDKAKNYIREGDIYQVNLSQRFETPYCVDPELYFRSLINTQPVPFASYIRFPDSAVISGSMELFLRREGKGLTTNPIKGTKKRGASDEDDDRLIDELRESEKERAENLMIVDLMRNDLSKVCIPGSVTVNELFSVKTFSTLHHLVSQVEGELRGDVSSMDIVRSTFPPGSVTGAPKRRALEIIDELEPHPRGPYCGAIGVFYPNGDFTLSVAIRLCVASHGKLTFWTGGGIVWDSEPNAEYEETILKAQALKKAIHSV